MIGGIIMQVGDIAKETISKKAVVMINKYGWDKLNARNLAKELKISTKPLFCLLIIVSPYPCKAF